jgi:hypothetical protein
MKGLSSSPLDCGELTSSGGVVSGSNRVGVRPRLILVRILSENPASVT